MLQFLIRTSRKPRPLPPGRWLMTQRWNDLLLAHWPLPASTIAPLLPEGLQVDMFQSSAWLGIIPFWLDRIKVRGIPPVPGLRSFPDLCLRTYVREEQTGAPGVYCLSLDGNKLLAAAMGRALYCLPYYWAEMHLKQQTERDFLFYSRRRFTNRSVQFKALYRGLGPTRKSVDYCAGSLEYFLMERYCLYSSNRARQLIRTNLNHVCWPLEEAEAEIERNDLAAAIGIQLPEQKPVLHYARRMVLYLWPAELLRPAQLARPITAAVTPLG
jgi:uncharacterized protein